MDRTGPPPPLTTWQMMATAAITAHGFHSTRVNGVLCVLMPYTGWDGCNGVEWLPVKTWGDVRRVLGY